MKSSSQKLPQINRQINLFIDGWMDRMHRQPNGLTGGWKTLFMDQYSEAKQKSSNNCGHPQWNYDYQYRNHNFFYFYTKTTKYHKIT